MGVKFFNYAEETFITVGAEQNFNQRIRQINCATRVNLAFKFFLKNIENGKFKHFYAHEIKILFDRSKFWCTGYDMAQLENVLKEFDVIEMCIKEIQRRIEKGRELLHKLDMLQFDKLDSVFWFIRRVTDGLQRCSFAELLSKNHTINWLTFMEVTRQLSNVKLCFIRRLVIHLHGNFRLTENFSEMFKLFTSKVE